MKRIQKLIVGLLASASLVSLASCAATRPNADEAFSIMGMDDANPGFGPRGHGPQGQRGPAMMMGFVMKDLNLSAEQMQQLQALRSEAFAQFKNQSNRPDRQAMREAFKTAFLSDHFDPAALKAQFQSARPNPQEMSKNVATHLLKAWQILTPEQQGKLEQKLSEMESRFAQFKAKRPQAGQNAPGTRLQKHLQQMADQLELTEAQQAQLKALWQQNRPQRQERMTEMKALKDKVLAELKSGHASVDSLSAILVPVFEQMPHRMDQHMSKMVALHDVLTPAQREKFVQGMEARAANFRQGRFGRQGHRGHHRGPGFNQNGQQN